MAKATVTVTDTEDGTVSVVVDFDPEVETKGTLTPAQWLALQMLKSAKNNTDEYEEDDEEC